MMYREELLNEFFNPQNVGVIRGANGVGKIVNRENGEIMKVYLSVQNGTIVDTQFQTFGCPVSIACTSVVTRLIKGKTLEEALKVTAKEIKAELGNEVPEGKEHSFKMAEKLIKKAVKNYDKKQKGIKSSGDEDDDDDEE